MKAVLIDTHALAWGLYASRRLSNVARTTIGEAENVFVSPASLYEMAHKVRLGKWPEMAPFLPNLIDELVEQGIEMVQLDAKICVLAGSMAWPHRDPFDRLLATTALSHAVPIVSADSIFDGIVSRIW
ncbi:type II toxin-antitoxin system VapC family toxin [Lichenihabitans psoromatis]|uniref:type II toxin-antitoxin system VapC family toxin n=1 Tax=Lichenihabitans psoromatis TaxID=2528642 RepID=UPI0010383667|nr:type II toxin-antitoxin system VapC family toxin [Lichenihabitans psoromatis]